MEFTAESVASSVTPMKLEKVFLLCPLTLKQRQILNDYIDLPCNLHDLSTTERPDIQRRLELGPSFP